MSLARAAVRRATVVGALALVLAMLAGVSPASATAKQKHASFKCPRGGHVGGVCAVPGAPCTTKQKRLYAERGLVCVRKKLKRGGLAVQRAGGEYAVQPNGQLGLAEAEQAFIAAGGTIPGVKPAAGDVALPPHADVTGPRIWIQRFLGRLKPRQRAAIKRELAGGAHAAFEKNTYLNEEEQILVPHLEAVTGVVLPTDPIVETGTVKELGKNPYTGGGNGGYAEPEYVNGLYKNCHVVILEAEAKPGPNAINVEGHELTHCFQEFVAHTSAQMIALPPWYVEGYAEWGGDTMEQELLHNAKLDPLGAKWIVRPHTDLFTRAYDAFPLYDEVAEEAGGPFAGPEIMWKEVAVLSKLSGSSAIYERLKALGGDEFERNLATNPILDGTLGKEWFFDGPGMEDSPRPEVPKKTLENGQAVTLGAPPRASDRDIVDIQSDLLRISGRAPGELHLSDGRNLEVEPTRLCNLEEGCMCPDGSDPATEGGQMGESVIATYGEMGGTTVTLTGESKQEACGEGSSGQSGGSGSAKVELKKPPSLTAFAKLTHVSCTATAGTLRVTLTQSSGGTPLTLTLPGYKQGQAHEFKFTAPSRGGPVATYGSLTTNQNLEEEGEAPPAGGASYNGSKFFLDATLFAAGANDGAFADGTFTC
jgi:uncharacterized membrane protein